jgi:hypothetical protein
MKFHSAEWVLDNKKYRNVLTEENRDDSVTRLEASPKSLVAPQDG